MKASLRKMIWIAFTAFLPFQAFATDCSLYDYFFGEPSIVKKHALADLELIKHVFEVQYAPFEWKKSHLGWDLDEEYKIAKKRINALKEPRTKEIQYILRDFFNTPCDYHVSALFYSTESATLPFLVKGAKGRYFITFIDRSRISLFKFPFREGDEIVTFGGRPIDEVISGIRKKYYGSNVLETDQALAELTLTNRFGSHGHVIPQGCVTIEGIYKGSKALQKVELDWDYRSEKIGGFTRKKASSSFSASLADLENEDLSLRDFFSKQMVFSEWVSGGYGCSSRIENRHSIGSRSSYIPTLGEKIWSTSLDSFFDAYIFVSPSKQKIGYLRIPHYEGSEFEVNEFKKIIRHLQKSTDALVIDQINNPGGLLLYMYALMSMLIDKPIEVPKHHLMLTQKDILRASQYLAIAEQIRTDKEAHLVFGEMFEGYPITLKTVKELISFCNFIIQEWEQGKTYTDPTPFFGISKLEPNKDVFYDKPILYLVNSLDISAGDFSAALLQDGKRATIFGTRTAGAGGTVVMFKIPNTSGIMGFSVTTSLAERVDHQPIENLGVTPDIFYELSVRDLQENYCEYVDKIVESIEALINK